MFCKEGAVRHVIKDLNVVEFVEFDFCVNTVEMLCKHKNTNEVISNFILDEKAFKACSDANYMCIVVEGDHEKGQFAIILTSCAEFDNEKKRACLDEVVGEINSTKDDVELLCPLAMKLKKGFLDCNIGCNTGNMPLLAVKNKQTNKKSLIFSRNKNDCN